MVLNFLSLHLFIGAFAKQPHVMLSFFIRAYKFIQIAHIIYDDALIFQSIYSGNAIGRHLK